MSKFYLFDYIKEYSGINEEILESLKFDLDKRIYYYGQHFKFPHEGQWLLRDLLSYEVKNFLEDYFIYFKIMLNNVIFDRRRKNILSNSYFKVNSELKKIGFGVYSPSWCMNEDKNILTNYNLYNITKRLQKVIRNGDFKELFSDALLSKIKDFRKNLEKFVIKNNFVAVCVPNDMCFFENLSIKVFRKANMPSFVFLHGLPAIYNDMDNNRADYLIVWGDRIKDNFVKAGVKKEKIFVSGHPYYGGFNAKDLRYSFDNILVVNKSMNGAQYSDRVVLSDRGNLITYLYSIQNALEKFQIKSVRVRLHPSENYVWYQKFIDTNFYKIDALPLPESLKKATLVIGPTSSVFLESTYYGVNYIVYEPCDNEFDLINFRLVPPFDGSDPRVPVAKTEEDLVSFLKNKTMNSPDFFGEYIKSQFDISFIKDIIG